MLRIMVQEDGEYLLNFKYKNVISHRDKQFRESFGGNDSLL